MGGQVLGGGVVVLVAVVLWLVYLLPSWNGRHQYNAAERNAVRLSQALRVLAETSETPREVQLELNARTALAQQRLARRMQSEREHAQLENAKAELAVERAQARMDAALARERAAAEAAAAAAIPAVRRARARRRARLAATIVGLVAVALAVWGAVDLILTGSQLLLWSSVAVASAAVLMLQRMATVQRRTVQREVVAMTPRIAGDVQDVALATDRVAWTPRELPRPLTASAGSRAAAVLDQADARAALRRAALEEAMRARAERARPTSLDAARAARVDEFAGGAAAGDDAIEAHVRQLLERRASGQ
ncbi:large exoprotein [uncultured Microbacterium sp.]|uniref:large exoprotein n=1 Tax=uncultured Microbacterium sp. TaxID=191216 RepID=UPI002611C094|nr:large exoprotein [uncultured Microbacterium sp.]